MRYYFLTYFTNKTTALLAAGFVHRDFIFSFSAPHPHPPLSLAGSRCNYIRNFFSCFPNMFSFHFLRSNLPPAPPPRVPVAKRVLHIAKKFPKFIPLKEAFEGNGISEGTEILYISMSHSLPTQPLPLPTCAHRIAGWSLDR